MNDKELIHYGVLGMRWGVRHDKEYKSGMKSLKSRGLSRDQFVKERAALRLKTANRLYNKNSSKMNNRIVNRNAIGTAAMSSLLGSYGTMRYDQARARGKGVVRSYLKGFASQVGNVALLGAPSMLEYASVRQARKYPNGKKPRQ